MNVDSILENLETLAESHGGMERIRELVLGLGTQIGFGISLEKSHKRKLCDISHVSWGNLSLTKTSYVEDGSFLAVSAAGPDGRINKAEHAEFTPVISAIGARCGTMFMPDERFTAIKNTMTVTPNLEIIDNWYLYYALKGSKLPRRGTAQPFLSKTDIDNFEIIVPSSLEEQQVIVNKINELMVLCDQLEQLQLSRDNIRVATRKSAIDAISTATTPEELETAWKRINENWEVIADTPESINSVRDLINNLAVRGLMSNTGKDEKPIDVPFLEGPFDLPPNWRWTRIQDVSNFVNGYAFPSGDYKEKGVGVVRMSDMKSGMIVTDRMKFVSQRYFDELSTAFRVSPGDLVMGMTGATLGKPCFNLTSATFLLNQRIGKFEPFAVDSRYLGIALLTLERLFMEVSFGTGVNNLSTKQIKESVFPIPPFEEQMRIVAKVEELMDLCDQLETGLMARSELAEKFARSVVSAA
jgi:type I restriction enzyme S subunit